MRGPAVQYVTKEEQIIVHTKSTYAYIVRTHRQYVHTCSDSQDMSIVQTVETETMKKKNIHPSIHTYIQHDHDTLHVPVPTVRTSTHPRVVRLACGQHSSTWQYHWWCRQRYIPPQDAQRTRSIQLYMMGGGKRDPSTHLSIYLSIALFIYVSIDPPPIYLYIHPFIYTYIHPFIYSSIPPFIYLSIHTSIHPSIHPSIYLFIYLWIAAHLQ